MQRYLILIEPTDTGYSAYSPDVPGCVATAASRSEIEKVMSDAIGFHLEGLRESGQPVPPPHTSASYVEVAA
ncbi:MAG: type II toxin-antitoxin system HicB family antitoxin [Gemmatimonadota bacterium]|nr:type II toxin-antitoxin system HicB family antitoxin [Gemmatimonadota bacterium]